MTLIEVIVVLVLLGVAAAIAVPSLVLPAIEPAGIGHVVRASRAAAIARAQTLRLVVASSGTWVLTDDSDRTVASGTVPGMPPVELALAPTGSCLMASALPAEWSSWDAVRCRADERSR